MKIAEPKRPTAPYGAFSTMKRNAIEAFVEGVPERIDRSAFPGLAWNAITRLIGGLRFLGLIDDDGTPQPALHKLAVPDEAVRKTEMEKLLRTSYSEVFKLDLARTTPALLADTLGGAYNATGDTREKAVRFFLQAVVYVGVPVSTLLLRDQTRKPTVRIKRRVTAAKPAEAPLPTPSAPEASSGATRTIHLASGGRLTLTAAIDFLTLTPSDRAFVFELIDKLSTYAQENPRDADADEDEQDD